MNEYDDASLMRIRVGRLSARVALATLLLLFTTDAWTAQAGGRVISGGGAIHATDRTGGQRALARGDEVYPGDLLTLGERAHVQLRMRDDALIELEAGSRFVIERYTESPGGNSAIMRLLRGAMRTITGAIGDAPDDTYRVSTPVATIGVRGTQYALHHCGPACAGENRAAGLYGRVDGGAVSASNDAANRVFRKSDYFYVAARDVAPRAIVRPPEGILDGGAVSSGLGPAFMDEIDDSLVGDGFDDTLESTTDTIGGTIDLARDTLSGGTDLGSTLDAGGDLQGDTLSDTTDTLYDTVEDPLDVLGGG